MAERPAPQLTYAEVGASAGPLPAGYHHLSRSYPLGAPDRFRRVVDGLMGWDVHRGAGLHVPSDTSRAAVGLDVAIRAGLGPLSLPVPCRVVYLVDEPDERGFAYGTLPGHPETGEERFTIRRTGNGLLFEVRAFSNPGTALTRLTGPLGRVVQRIATDRYGSAARRLSRSA